jgi:flagellar basal-body rod protein FlgC
MPNPIQGTRGLIAGVEARPMFRTLGIAASGMTAQRMRLEAIAGNIANSETTRTEDGTPYRRMPPRFQFPSIDPVDAANGVRVAAIQEDLSEGPLVYDPGHPDADEAGYVRYPNVSITEELVDLMSARRVYEANVTVFQSARSMLRRALEI